MRKPIKNLSVVKALFFLLAILYSIALVWLSLTNLSKLPIHVGGSDKVYHGIAYFGLVFFWSLSVFFSKSSMNFKVGRLLLVTGGAVLFGIIIEVLQLTLTNYRNWDFYDMLANLTGAFLAFLVLLLSRKKLEKIKNRK